MRGCVQECCTASVGGVWRVAKLYRSPRLTVLWWVVWWWVTGGGGACCFGGL